MSNRSIQNHQIHNYVYLIEDDVILRDQLAGVLEDADITVIRFATAETFLLQGVRHSPAVIVSDVVLPGLSGISLLEAIRGSGIETPLIFISGYSEPNQIIAGMKLGAVDFLWKPFKSEVLLKSVSESLALDRMRNERDEYCNKITLRWNILTEREREVCKLMISGYGNTVIAQKLGIQPDTANKHRMKVLVKMDVKERGELVELLKDFEPAK